MNFWIIGKLKIMKCVFEFLIFRCVHLGGLSTNDSILRKCWVFIGIWKKSKNDFFNYWKMKKSKTNFWIIGKWKNQKMHFWIFRLKPLSVSRTPNPWSHTWRTLMIPDWRLGGWGHPWCLGSSSYVILDFCAKFQLSSMNRSVSRTPCPQSHTWRTLKVPDWILGGWGHPWCVGSSWETPRNVSWKFHEDLTSFGWFMKSWDFG